MKSLLRTILTLIVCTAVLSAHAEDRQKKTEANSRFAPSSSQKSKGAQNEQFTAMQKRLDSLESHIAELVIAINRNAGNLKDAQAQLKQLIVSGATSKADSERAITELKARLNHDTVESAMAAQGVSKEIEQIRSQLSEHIVRAAQRHADRAVADTKRLDHLEAWQKNQTITTSENDNKLALELKNLKAQMANSVVTTAQTTSDVKQLAQQIAEKQPVAVKSAVQQQEKRRGNLRSVLDARAGAQAIQRKDSQTQPDSANRKLTTPPRVLSFENGRILRVHTESDAGRVDALDEKLEAVNARLERILQLLEKPKGPEQR